MVRCYPKKEGGRYRVELELHSPWLRKHGVKTVADLPAIASAVWPAHICFKVMRWEKLESHLIRKYGKQRGEKLLKEARGHADISLHRVNRFLSNTVHNPHRFWGSSIVNRDIREALQRWMDEFEARSQINGGGEYETG
jgi:hypothetical protein